jgi:hypothetical protein
MDTLPDELIKEIISPALKVSDEVFSDTSPTSPFAGYSQSTSVFLVVSKTWLRVATPLLYHIVVLRSKAQAQALEAALRENKLLGTFIKKLRLEGGFGSALYPIITSAPNLTDLFLSFDIWSADSVSGLCRGLPKMNPTRIILDDKHNDRFSNAPLRQLVKVVCQCLKTWTNLVKLKSFLHITYVT